MSPWGRLLEKPHPGDHFVQLYDAGETGLADNVGHYLWEGLKRGEGVLLVVTPEHQTLLSRFLDHVGADLATLLDSRQLVFWDARRTLSRFMVDGQPDWRLFEKAIRAAVREVRPADGAEGLRAYGEMVSVLWKAHQFAAAVRVEQLWNKLLEQQSFSLYCSYAVDVLDDESELANLESVLCAHTHLIPADADGDLEAAIHRSMDKVLGPRADAIRARIKTHDHARGTVLPSAENSVLWLRTNLPEEADRIVSLAREYYGQRAQTAGS
jgi:KaiC/GvpD/RAD55 family RecA-like ATPase